MRLLDLFCGAGGAGAGYARAGFEVVGVDLRPQPDYPYEFHQADATTFPLDGFDAIHASPPCQRWTHGNVANDITRHPDLIGATRDRLVGSGVPWVIENVPRAPLVDPLVLCGSMFDLRAVDHDGTLLHLRRHRHFESSVALTAPRACRHPRGVQWAGAYGGARRDKHEARNVRHGGYVPPFDVLVDLLGIDWTNEAGMFQAIPPAYTEHIGRGLLVWLT